MEKVVLVSLVGGLREAGKYNRAMAPFYLKNFAMADPLIANSFDLEILLFDLEDNEETILKEIYRAQPAAAAFSLFFWTAEQTLSIARKLKLVSPKTIIIAGGPQVTEELFRESPWIDCAARGEGEKVFRDFLARRAEGRGPDTVPGLMHRINGKAVTGVGFNVLDNLDEIPPLSAIEDFSDLRHSSPEKKFPLEISRGCPFKCSYCSWNLHEVRFLSTERFEANLQYLLPGLPDRRETIIDFIDSYLDIDADRLKAALRVMAKHRRPHVKYRGYFLFRNIDNETADLLEAANFKYLYIGLQSSDRKLAAILNRKWFRPESLDRALQLGSRFHITVDLILGLPGDSYLGFRETVKYLWAQGFDNIVSTRLRVIPGTTFFTSPEYGISFDRNPPHMAFDVKSFPLEDVFRASRFAANFTVLRKLLRREDFSKILEYTSIDPFNICDIIHEKESRWNENIIKAGPGCNDVSFNPDIAFVLSDFLNNMGNSTAGSKALEELLLLRRAEFIMKNLLEETLGMAPTNSPASSRDAVSKKLFLPGYEKLLLKHNLFVPAVSDEWGRMGKSEKTFFLFNNYRDEKTEVIKSEIPELVEILFKLLVKPTGLKDARDLMVREISGINPGSLDSFIESLLEKGALVYQETEG